MALVSRGLLVLGLGNPGRKYQETRHNAGFWFVSALAAHLGLRWYKPLFKPWRLARGSFFTLVQPLTWMNRSGEILARPPFLDWAGPLVVAVDTMDLPPGTVRLKARAGTAGHNGLKSIQAQRPGRFYPLYIGVGRPAAGTPVIDHVLGVPTADERQAINHSIDRTTAILASAGLPEAAGEEKWLGALCTQLNQGGT